MEPFGAVGIILVMEITHDTKYRHIPGFGDRYRVYRCGAIYRKAYDKELPSGKIRHYKSKKLVARHRRRKGGGVSDLMEVTITDGIQKKAVLVSQIVLYAWKFSFQRSIWNYPEIIFLNDDWSDYHIDNLRLYDSRIYEDEECIPHPVTFAVVFPDGSKYFSYRVYKEDYEPGADFLWNIEHKMTASQLQELMNRKADEVGMPTIEIITDDPQDERRGEELLKWKIDMNKAEGRPFNPLPNRW